MPIARADIKFGLYSDFLDRTLSAEDERLHGESIEDGVIRVHDALERAAAILKKRVQNSEPVDSGMDLLEHMQRSSPPTVIDLKEVRAKEELEDQILSATSLNELAIIKEACGKAGLVTQYMKRLNQLMTNG
jgi:hypothetical protein